MRQICIFAGTTEGRKLAEFLAGQKVGLTVCVATEYGGEMLAPSQHTRIVARRLPPDQIRELLRQESFDLVIDATHPYARSITEHLEAICKEQEVSYLRLLREASVTGEDAVFVPDIRAAAAFLNQTEGNILLTTGSKELVLYQEITGFTDRVYARVLPMEASLISCQEAGLKPDHILAMQGPFSEELNTAMLRFLSARWMVTKDGGNAGGFAEKEAAARNAGARLVVIGRPAKEQGLSYAQIIRYLCREFDCKNVPQITIAGIGPGNSRMMTQETKDAISEAQCLIGAGRMLEGFSFRGQEHFEAISPEVITSYILEHPEYQKYTVLMSGDTGFFSGTKKLLGALRKQGFEGDPSGQSIRVLPGISSLSYLCSKLGTSYEQVRMVSLHGREGDIVSEVLHYPRVFVLVGGESGICGMCRTLTDAGLGEVLVSVGERLSYPEEKITAGMAKELAEQTFASLSVALIERKETFEASLSEYPVTAGFPDDWFQRGAGESGIVPMTKSEVRAICLSKLQLTEDSICWDIGAGTGSVSMEMALRASKGWVYAIEQKEAALELLERNKYSFGIRNLTVKSGTAPEDCEDLPAPTHVFIGGSSGNLRSILSLILRKNPGARIVATAVSLESAAQLTECLKEMNWAFSEVCTAQIARDRKAGSYHLMNGQNPVAIFTMQKEVSAR